MDEDGTSWGGGGQRPSGQEGARATATSLLGKLDPLYVPQALYYSCTYKPKTLFSTENVPSGQTQGKLCTDLHA